jgi:hypothetical protein
MGDVLNSAPDEFVLHGVRYRRVPEPRVHEYEECRWLASESFTSESRFAGRGEAPTCGWCVSHAEREARYAESKDRWDRVRAAALLQSWGVVE